MEILTQAAQLILSLSILVTLHEFGHYIPARLFKTRIEKFYLFFDPWFSLYKKKIGDTEWGIGWLPLGGYVKIAGMVDESMDTEQLKKPAQPWEFRSKPAWQRLIIMIGGVTVNIVVGFFIYMGIVYFYGLEELKPSSLKEGLAIHPELEKYGLESGDNIIRINDKDIRTVNEINAIVMLRKGYKLDVVKKDGTKTVITLPEKTEMELFQKGAFPAFGLRGLLDTLKSVDSTGIAYKAGLKTGDRILKIDGKELVYFDDLQKATYSSKNKEVEVVFIHDQDTISKQVKFDEKGLLGVGVSQNFLDEESIITRKYSLPESFGKGWELGTNTLSDYISQFKFVFTKKGATSIGGFGTMGKIFPTTWNWKIFWMNTAFISIVLAFMNILPIPALDGGHVIFLLYELITGKEAPQKVLEIAQYIGIVLLLSLMLYANGNDIYRWLFT
ncbi:MAG: RIP metalloprotease RseP [Flavobacteriia bacterium]|nr:RIP metalloprotease RseP [Flavobacteriia bacterium]OJX35320.1 MAG: RIP metalloprotease RseP [Flavobacteriia bacterium 40-80]